MMNLNKIHKPTLLIDKQKCRRNIQFMIDRAKNHGVELRPHFKTHQSLEIGQWFKEQGVSKITVSSLEMANYFSEEWDDITVAFPVNIREIETINELSRKINLNLLVESGAVVQFLKNHLKSAVNLFIKINIGNDRTGLKISETEKINAILNVIKSSNKINFRGFLGHAGQTYKCRGQEAIQITHEEASSLLKDLKAQYVELYPNLMLSYGDTPSCSVANGFHGIDEIRPGNFVFYDTMQVQIGSCDYEQIAVAMACPIISIHPNRSELVIYGGGIHFSKDRIIVKDELHFGQIAELTNKGWSVLPESFVKGLSQEHGVVYMPQDKLKEYSVGDLLIVLPVHSCMTANLMNQYQTFSGAKISMMKN